jgi:hypothetical protein
MDGFRGEGTRRGALSAVQGAPPRRPGSQRGGTADSINCRERQICNEPLLCLKAYLFCKKRWMEKELRSLAAGTPYAEVARVLLGEGDIPEECGGQPKNCAVRC